MKELSPGRGWLLDGARVIKAQNDKDFSLSGPNAILNSQENKGRTPTFTFFFLKKLALDLSEIYQQWQSPSTQDYFRIMEFSPEAAELTTLLESRITNFYTNLKVDELDRVVSVGDGIARVYGLKEIQTREMVEFASGVSSDTAFASEI